MATMSGLPPLPAPHATFVQYVANHPDKPIIELLKPYKDHDTKLRELFAQEPNNPILKDPYVNVVPVFDNHTSDLKVRARDLAAESSEEQSRYVMPLDDRDRKKNGSPAVVESLEEFQHNFGVFSESSLSDLDWSNVVAAGSSVVTSMLPVPVEYSGSRRALREYYHQVIAPASDVDLFLYGLSEEEAIEKIKQIETKVRDSILEETTTIRTKHAITICSQYPTRHIQIVLRIYKSVSEILQGFDVDCSCAAYDGQQVWAAPRALASYMTQINHVDLSRRSPSYENRLSKYSHRGFEVYWPLLDRSRIDPTIFERSFQRTEGLARLLVLEKLPNSSDRDAYTDQRRRERGRPPLNRYFRNSRFQYGNIKAGIDDEVAEWVDEEDVSDYHTFTVPYGIKFTAKKIEKLLYTKDILLNAEWNRSKDREVDLHRHPAFFGTAADVFEDCCGSCPKPTNADEEEIAEEESKIYVSGRVSFIRDNPGRQTIGSFHPITDDDWTEMAYVGNTTRLCQAIVDGDLDHVKDWLAQEGSDPNRRDHTGRTPLQLAAGVSTPAIVRALVNHNARLVARQADGRTALHIAAARGDVEIVKILMIRSEANEAEEEVKKLKRRDQTQQVKQNRREQRPTSGVESEDEDMSDVSDAVLRSDDGEFIEADDVMSASSGSYVKVSKASKKSNESDALPVDDDEDEPDFYDVDVLTWDHPCSPLHLAIINGHTEVVKELCSTFGADVLLPIKMINDYDRSPRAAILTLVLALSLPEEHARSMIKTLLDMGATARQADLNGLTAFHFFVEDSTAAVKTLLDLDPAAVRAVVNHLIVGQHWYNARFTVPLLTAIETCDADRVNLLLDASAKVKIEFPAFMKAAKAKIPKQLPQDHAQHEKTFHAAGEQPICLAIMRNLPEVAIRMLKEGADPNTMTSRGWQIVHDTWYGSNYSGQTAYDLVIEAIESLEAYEEEPFLTKAPHKLQDDQFYLQDLEPGTYKYACVEHQLRFEKSQRQNEVANYQSQLDAHKNRSGVTEKKEAINALIPQFVELRKLLESMEAKKFEELYPEKPKPTKQPPYQYKPWRRPAFEVKFNFEVTGFDDRLRQPYIDLFEAAWRGDLRKIKMLTTQPRGKNRDQPPLQISVSDTTLDTPFSIAVKRGHLDVAREILAICDAQYVPAHKQTKRYRIAGHDGDVDDIDDNESDVDLEAMDADDEYTIDNAGEQSLDIECDVSALDLMTKLTSHSSTTIWDLFSLAIVEDNLELLTFLLDLGQKYTVSQTDEDGPTFFSMKENNLYLAIELGRLKMLSLILSKTGAGIPLEDLVEKSGAEIKEQPKFYQGLSVHGKKRADWAMAGREVIVQKSGSSHSLVLVAAQKGSMDALDWFMSDAPLRCYSDFAATFKNDKRVQHLAKSGGGFNKVIEKWLNTRASLLIHCAILAKPNKESHQMLNRLITQMPHLIEKKNFEGRTPLHVAFSLHHIKAARMLINAGADTMAKDKGFRNVLHFLLAPFLGTVCENEAHVGSLLDMLDPKVRMELMKQRNGYSAGAYTPLHHWISCTQHHDEGRRRKILDVWLKHSRGVELDMINGAGETPLHTLIQSNNETISKMLMMARPELLHRENATGRTPLEIAWDKYNASVVTKESQLAESTRHSYYRTDTSTSLASKNPTEFLKADPDSQIPVTTRLLKLCQRVAAEHPEKRRLVTLNEANEVARRLADTKKRGPSEYGPSGERLKIQRVDDDEMRDIGDVDENAAEDHKGDEINAWYMQAANYAEEDDNDEEDAGRMPN